MSLELNVTSVEADKLRWLLGVIAAADEMQHRFKSDRQTLMFDEGVRIDRVIDWRAVSNRVLPDVIVVMVKDERRDAVFDEFPMYALLPRLKQYVSLQEELVLTVEVDTDRSHGEVVSALNRLTAHARELTGSRGENAMKQLTVLRRTLKL